MTVLDLCCGTGGWSEGFVAEGWTAIGIDVRAWTHPKVPAFPGELILADVRQLDPRQFLGRVDLVVASPPCVEFSRARLPYKSGRRLAALKPPDLSIVRACESIAAALSVPLVLENVQGAVPYLGKPAHRCGPFYLWGDGVPPMLPQAGPSKWRAKKRGLLYALPVDDHAHTWRSVLAARIPLILGRAVARWHAARLQARAAVEAGR